MSDIHDHEAFSCLQFQLVTASEWNVMQLNVSEHCTAGGDDFKYS